MSGEKKTLYDSKIADKYKSALAQRLRELVPDTKTANALKEHLEVSIQAINQYKQGTAYPKTENLIKIADFFGISVDYLLGYTNIPNRDTNLQVIHDLTGLSVEAICKINEMKAENLKTGFTDIISLLLESSNVEYLLYSIGEMISYSLDKTGEKLIHVDVDGAKMVVPKDKMTKTIFQTNLMDTIPLIVSAYKERFGKSPRQRREEFERECSE